MVMKMSKHRLILLIVGVIVSFLALQPVFASNNNHSGNRNNGQGNFPQLAINGNQYTTAIGVRAMGTSGITIKHHTSRGYALEGILGFWPDALSATVLFEKYTNAFDVPGLNWYYGGGGHLAIESDFVDHPNEGRYERADGDLGIGIDGIFGIEYKIDQTPIAISLDLKPFLEISTDGGAFVAADPGLGIKVTF